LIDRFFISITVFFSLSKHFLFVVLVSFWSVTVCALTTIPVGIMTDARVLWCVFVPLRAMGTYGKASDRVNLMGHKFYVIWVNAVSDST
jgi:hypothetical protein